MTTQFKTLLGVALALAMTASAEASSGTACKLDATLDLSATPWTRTSTPFQYTLAGTLSSCNADPQSGVVPADATVEAGKLWTTPDGKQYREPTPSGTNGSCASLTQVGWSGTAIVKWAGGAITLIALGGASVGPAGVATGNVVPSLKLTPVNPKDPSLTLTTTLYVGFSSLGPIVLSYSPVDCATAAVSSATVTGAYGIYKYAAPGQAAPAFGRDGNSLAQVA